jgi:hypothetical protein
MDTAGKDYKNETIKSQKWADSRRQGGPAHRYSLSLSHTHTLTTILPIPTSSDTFLLRYTSLAQITTTRHRGTTTELVPGARCELENTSQITRCNKKSSLPETDRQSRTEQNRTEINKEGLKFDGKEERGDKKKANVNRHRTSGDDKSKKQQMEQLQSLFTILRHGGEDKIKAGSVSGWSKRCRIMCSMQA